MTSSLAAPSPLDDVASRSASDLYFGKFVIPASHVFYTSPSKLSAALVNLKPIVPGHVLVIPTRKGAIRMKDLTTDEHADLWATVRVVQEKVERHHDCEASNVAAQDGRPAGQSVPHVHVHILPRKDGDFEVSDEVYELLDQWGPWVNPEAVAERRKKGKKEGGMIIDDSKRRNRSSEEMAAEADLYR
jgi:bis(5'-adenosyl)-triphosphatase